MVQRSIRLIFLLLVSWVVMVFTHEVGHIAGGLCSGGVLESADLLPWHLPYSVFSPDPYPRVTLWSGLLVGVVIPLGLAIAIRRDWMWFVASFCVLANGMYIATAWVSGDSALDTARLLAHGASPLTLGIYCMLTIGWGYVRFRRACIAVLAPHTESDPK